MTLAEAVEEVLRRSDEAFVDVSEDRARRSFYVALTEVLRGGEYQDTDARGFIHRVTNTIPVAPADPILTLDTLMANREILSIRSVYLEPEEYEDDAPTTFLTRATKEEVKKWGIPDLQPRYDRKFYQVGNTLYFYPTAVMPGLELGFELVVAPLPYDDAPGFDPATNWGDTTELTDWMTTYLQNAVIEAAANLFRQEVAVNVG